VIPISVKEIPHREPKAAKVEAVTTLSDLLDRASGVVLTDYRGFTVKEKTDLTRRLRAANAEYHVVKNTLFRLAYKERGEDPGTLLEGPTAVVFALEDPVKPAKVMLDFIKEKRKGTVKGGIVDGKVFTTEGVTKLSELPPKDQLIAQVVGAIQGPLYGLVWSLQGIPGSLARAIQAIHDQKLAAESGEAAAA